MKKIEFFEIMESLSWWDILILGLAGLIHPSNGFLALITILLFRLGRKKK